MNKVLLSLACTVFIATHTLAQETAQPSVETVQPSAETAAPNANASPLTDPNSPAPVVPVQTKPSGPPPGFKDAVKLYNSRKFPQAMVKFQQFVKDGTADDDTHRYLAGTYQQMKKYTKAVGEYEWISKNARSMTTRRQAAETARRLRSQMKGICPMPCLKATDHWVPNSGNNLPAGIPVVKFAFAGGTAVFSKAHMGHLIKRNGGSPAQDVGLCPVCEGTGRVPALKDK